MKGFRFTFDTWKRISQGLVDALNDQVSTICSSCGVTDVSIELRAPNNVTSVSLIDCIYVNDMKSELFARQLLKNCKHDCFLKKKNDLFIFF